MKTVIAHVADGKALSEEETLKTFLGMMSGEATPAQMGAFLMALRLRGETLDELIGATRALRSKVLAVKAPAEAIDIVGTGGDGSGTFNISTGAAFVLAAIGVPVAKHGNRALSSRSGSADVLTALGIDIDAPVPVVEAAIRQTRIGFMMAPRHHRATMNVAPVRVELGIRTIFNLLGPLANPAGVTRQMTGVYDPRWLEPFARVLGRLGSTRAWIVHGHDGLDELSTTGPSRVAELLEDGAVRLFEVTPEQAGLPRARLADLKGGDAQTNASAMLAMLGGQPGAFRDAVLLNAAAAMIVAGEAADLAEGVRRGAQVLDDGRAMGVLVALRQSQGIPAPEQSDDE